jgi:4,5:9,10-diseco-3-hydroxy-5,9,17-trioxoandrosta-1(10),2-diene-4-oate hydrolase
MNEIQNKNIDVKGLSINYLKCGHGDPLIIIHGGSRGAESWISNILELSAHFSVYVPNLPGFGGSQLMEGNPYIPELAAFMDNFLRALKIEKCYLIGHSIGGGVALNYALKYPRKIIKLVLISSICLGKDIAFWIRILSAPCRFFVNSMSCIMNGIEQLVNFFIGPDYSLGFVNPTKVTFGSKISRFGGQSLILSQRLPEIAVPTLLVWGDKDRVVPVKQALSAASLIRDCQLKIFENSGHSAYKENIIEFSQTVRSFLT